MTDAELIRLWRDGNAAAFEAIVARWQQPIARFLYRYAGVDNGISDLCQEVFLRLYCSGPRYRENGVFSSWLYRIALNVARDAGRRNRRPTLSLVNQEIIDRSSGAEDRCQQQELVGCAADALALLPEALRLVLVLRHYEHLSFEDIARLTGTPASTVKSRFAAALGRMRDQLQQSGWGPEETTT
ncbi:sigma-70 family RNA polymerase sigma factor [soil metagenome]